ncbi:MAG TPA: PLP-dependent transferase, partial [Devosiaceae bacterium]|nr:PLP-dependent transferase [Devosiaceae bacterium]
KGLETLELRVQQMTRSAGAIANFLAGHPNVERIHYPDHPSHPQHNLARAQMDGGSTMVAFEVKGGKAQAFEVADALAIVRISNNLGDAKSIVTHPWTTTHQRLPEDDRLAMGITPALLRLSVGLEAEQDLLADLDYGLGLI